MPKFSKNFLWDKLKKTLKENNLEKKKLLNSKIFITGGTGYIGSWIIHGLAILNEKYKLNIELTILTSNRNNHNKYFFLNKKIKIKYIVDEISKLKKTNLKYTHLIHAAAIYKGTKKNIHKTNIIGTNRILNFVKKHKIQNLVFLSSGAVYEHGIKRIKLNENSKKVNLNSKNFYAISKIKGERKFLNYLTKTNINLSILRLFTFAGPGTATLNFLAYTSAINSKFKQKNIKLNSDGNSHRSFMHSIDMACWILKSLTIDNLNIINVGSDKSVKIIDLMTLISEYKITGLKKIKVLKSTNYKDNSFYIPSIKIALRKKYKILHTLDEAIKDDLLHRKITNNAHRYFFQ